MKPAIVILLLFIPFVADAGFRSCPRDMAGIETTDHLVLTASDRDRVGFDYKWLGDPNTDYQNFLNAIYNNFLSPYGQGHFFYESQLFNDAVPFLTNDRTIQFGMCNLQGQCVQADFRIEFDFIIVPAFVRSSGIPKLIIPAEIQTVPDYVVVRYVAPNGQQYSQRVHAMDGTLPESQPVIDNAPDQPDCLDNEGNVTMSYEDRGGQFTDSRGDRYDDYSDLRDWEEAWGGIPIPQPICGRVVIDDGGSSTSSYTCL